MIRARTKRKRKSAFRALYICLVILLVGILLKQEWNIYKINSAAKDAQVVVDGLKHTQTNLQQEVSNLHDLSYIERVARSEYKMIKPNEIPVIIKE